MGRSSNLLRTSILTAWLSVALVSGFVPSASKTSVARGNTISSTSPALHTPRYAVVDANAYNVELDQAAELWTVRVGPQNSIDRPAGIPFLDSNSKDYFVDDVKLVLERDAASPSLGVSLTELAGGREDGYGLTIVDSVSGNAEACGILPGDVVASIECRTIISKDGGAKKGLDSEERVQLLDCECRDFDTTMEELVKIPPPTPEEGAQSLVVNLKRIRR